MPGWVKKMVTVAVVAFAFVFIVARPDDAAGAVHAVADAGQSVFQFLKSLATS
jgi:hypothetical protein